MIEFFKNAYGFFDFGNLSYGVIVLDHYITAYNDRLYALDKPKLIDPAKRGFQAFILPMLAETKEIQFDSLKFFNETGISINIQDLIKDLISFRVVRVPLADVVNAIQAKTFVKAKDLFDKRLEDGTLVIDQPIELLAESIKRISSIENFEDIENLEQIDHINALKLMPLLSESIHDTFFELGLPNPVQVGFLITGVYRSFFSRAMSVFTTKTIEYTLFRPLEILQNELPENVYLLSNFSKYTDPNAYVNYYTLFDAEFHEGGEYIAELYNFVFDANITYPFINLTCLKMKDWVKLPLTMTYRPENDDTPWIRYGFTHKLSDYIGFGRVDISLGLTTDYSNSTALNNKDAMWCLYESIQPLIRPIINHAANRVKSREKKQRNYVEDLLSRGETVSDYQEPYFKTEQDHNNFLKERSESLKHGREMSLGLISLAKNLIPTVLRLNTIISTNNISLSLDVIPHGLSLETSFETNLEIDYFYSLVTINRVAADDFYNWMIDANLYEFIQIGDVCSQQVLESIPSKAITSIPKITKICTDLLYSQATTVVGAESCDIDVLFRYGFTPTPEGDGKQVLYHDINSFKALIKSFRHKDITKLVVPENTNPRKISIVNYEYKDFIKDLYSGYCCMTHEQINKDTGIEDNYIFGKIQKYTSKEAYYEDYRKKMLKNDIDIFDFSYALNGNIENYRSVYYSKIQSKFIVEPKLDFYPNIEEETRVETSENENSFENHFINYDNFDLDTADIKAFQQTERRLFSNKQRIAEFVKKTIVLNGSNIFKIASFVKDVCSLASNAMSFKQKTVSEEVINAQSREIVLTAQEEQFLLGSRAPTTPMEVFQSLLNNLILSNVNKAKEINADIVKNMPSTGATPIEVTTYLRNRYQETLAGFYKQFSDEQYTLQNIKPVIISFGNLVKERSNIKFAEKVAFDSVMGVITSLIGSRSLTQIIADEKKASFFNRSSTENTISAFLQLTKHEIEALESVVNFLSTTRNKMLSLIMTEMAFCGSMNEDEAQAFINRMLSKDPFVAIKEQMPDRTFDLGKQKVTYAFLKEMENRLLKMNFRGNLYITLIHQDFISNLLSRSEGTKEDIDISLKDQLDFYQLGASLIIRGIQKRVYDGEIQQCREHLLTTGIICNQVFNDPKIDQLTKFRRGFNPFLYRVTTEENIKQEDANPICAHNLYGKLDFKGVDELPISNLGLNKMYYLSNDGEPRLYTNLGTDQEEVEVIIDADSEGDWSNTIDPFDLEGNSAERIKQNYGLEDFHYRVLEQYRENPLDILVTKSHLRKHIIKYILHESDKEDQNTPRYGELEMKIDKALKVAEAKEANFSIVKQDILNLFATYKEGSKARFDTKIKEKELPYKMLKTLADTKSNPKQFIEELSLVLADLENTIHNSVFQYVKEDPYGTRQEMRDLLSEEPINSDALKDLISMGLIRTFAENQKEEAQETILTLVQCEKVIDILSNIIIYEHFRPQHNLYEDDKSDSKKLEYLTELARNTELVYNEPDFTVIMLNKQNIPTPLFLRTPDIKATTNAWFNKEDLEDGFGTPDAYKYDNIESFECRFTDHPDCISGSYTLKMNKEEKILVTDKDDNIRQAADKLADMFNNSVGGLITRNKDLYITLTHRKSFFVKPTCFDTPLEFTFIFSMPFDTTSYKIEKLSFIGRINILTFLSQIVIQPIISVSGYIGSNVFGN